MSSTILSLSAAQKLIVASCPALPPQPVLLAEAAGRIPAGTIIAPWPVPAFARSAMDGYAVNHRDLAASPTALPVSGEIAAGTTCLPKLCRGKAIRIMTGGALPKGADQVIPCERCRIEDGLVLTGQKPQVGAFIRQRGSNLNRGQTILRAGMQIEAQHLPLLAESGLNELPVVTRPTIALLCTGSELLNTADTPVPGQIIGGNRFLLGTLLHDAGALPLDLGLVSDELDRIVSRIEEALKGPAHGLITTGGMGPGKYDLLPRAFAALGIRPLYESLAVRPGRSTMFGLAQGKPIFALPGPPPAVFLLFHELVRPALRALEGRRRPLPPRSLARLTAPIFLKKTGILNLKGGVARLDGDSLSIRPTRQNEAANAIIHIPANRKALRAGEKVGLRLCGPGL